MGKSRRNRGRGAPRADPLGRTVKPLSDPELSALRETKVLPVIRDLKSSDPKNRAKAASAISNIIEDEKCRKLLLREQVVGIVLTGTITDSSLESRAAGWQILRVLVQMEGQDFCIHLYRVDVLSAINHAAAKILESLSSSETPFAKLAEAHRSFIWDIGWSLVVILSGLVAAQDDIVNSVMKQDSIAGFLLSVLSNDATPDEVRLPALDLVMDLAEDNLALAQLILSGKENNTFKGLHRLALGQGPASAPACGILHSVFAAMQWHDQNKGEDGACDAILVDPLSRIISHVARDPSSIAKEDVLSGSLHSVRQALEILADIGTYLLHSMKGSEHDRQEEPEWNGFSDDEDAKMEDVDADNGIADSDAEEEEDDGSDDMEDIEADMEMVTAFDDPEPVNGIDDLQTLSQLLQKAVPHLITISNIVYDNEDARMIREMALSVLGNLAWTVSSLDFSDAHNAGVQRAWTPVAMKIWKEIISTTISSNTTDLLLARRVASLAWAVSRSLHGEVPLAADEHQRFMSLYQATKRQDPSSPQPGSAAGEAEDPFLETGVMCVGVLGQLALPPAPLSVNRDIGIFLLTIVSSTPQSPPADVVEALGQLFDIYADEDAENDQIFWELKFLDHLEEVQPKIKAMVKSLDKRKVPELRNRADEAVLNLGRFIQYKRKHRPQMKVNGSGM